MESNGMNEKPTEAPAQPDMVNTELPDDIKAQIKPDDHPETPDLPQHAAEAPLPQTEQLILPPRSHRQAYIISGIILLLIAAAVVAYFRVKK